MNLEMFMLNDIKLGFLYQSQIFHRLRMKLDCNHKSGLLQTLHFKLRFKSHIHKISQL